MKEMLAALLLLLCASVHVFAADGDVGAACVGGTGGTCPDTNAYCTSDGNCACKTNFGKKGTGCALAVDQPCGAGQCLDNAVCTNDVCTCDTANGFEESTGTCVCPSTKYEENGKCVKKIDETCSGTECGTGDGVTCDTTCKCDAANNYVAKGSKQGCDCADGYTKRDDGTCGKDVLVCSADSDCMANAKCTDNDCVCDDTKGFKASSSGDTCECDTANSWVAKSDGSCVRPVSGDCTNGEPCTDDAACSSNACACDSTKHFVTDGGNGCQCDTDFVLESGACVRQVGGDCTNNEPCTAGAACETNACACVAANHFVGDGNTGCQCDTGFVLESGACVRQVGGDCTNSEPCTAGADCVSNACACVAANHFVGDGNTGCQCGTGFHLESGSCVRPPGGDCSNSEACTANAVCSSNACACGQDFVVDGNSCACKTDHSLKTSGTACGQGVKGAACSGDSDCTPNAKCTSGACVCDSATGYIVNTGTGVCDCDTTGNWAMSGGACVKKTGQTCTDSTECVVGATCSGTGSKTCSCDTARNFAAGTPQASSCSCDSGYTLIGTECRKTIDQTCATANECIPGATCAGSPLQCKCDTASGYADGSGGAASCTCNSAANYASKSSGGCGKHIGQACNSSTDCIDDAICDAATNLCACDAANGYSGSAGSCSCNSATHATKTGGPGGCGKKLAQACSSSCTDLATCNATAGACECDSNAEPQTDTKTCTIKSGSAGLFTPSLMWLLLATVIALLG